MADSNKNNVTLRLEWNLSISGTEVKVSKDVLEWNVIQVENASVLIYDSEAKTKIERLVVNIAGGKLTVVKRGLGQGQDPTEDKNLKKDWRVWAYVSIVTFTNNIPDRNNDWLQASGKKIFWWSKECYLYGDGNWEIFIKDKNNPETSLSEILEKWWADAKVRISQNDIKSSFLGTKLTTTNNLSKTTESPLWDEKMKLDINFDWGWFVNDFVSWDSWKNKWVKTGGDWRINKNLLPEVTTNNFFVEWEFWEDAQLGDPLRLWLNKVFTTKTVATSWTGSSVTMPYGRWGIGFRVRAKWNTLVKMKMPYIGNYRGATTVKIFNSSWMLIATSSYWTYANNVINFTFSDPIIFTEGENYDFFYTNFGSYQQNIVYALNTYSDYISWLVLASDNTTITTSSNKIPNIIEFGQRFNENVAKCYKAKANNYENNIIALASADYTKDSSGKIITNGLFKDKTDLVGWSIYYVWLNGGLTTDDTGVAVWPAYSDSELGLSFWINFKPNFISRIEWSWNWFNIAIPSWATKVTINANNGGDSRQFTLYKNWLTSANIWPSSSTISATWEWDNIKFSGATTVSAYFFKQ